MADKYTIARHGKGFEVQESLTDGKAQGIAIFRVSDTISEFQAYEHAAIFVAAMAKPGKKHDAAAKHVQRILKQFRDGK